MELCVSKWVFAALPVPMRAMLNFIIFPFKKDFAFSTPNGIFGKILLPL